MNIKKKIEKILEDCEEVDWGWNGEDEVPETYFDSETATKELMKLFRKELKERLTNKD